jgi:thymidylate synthase (FAD)
MDILENKLFKVLDHGEVEIINCMPGIHPAEKMIVRAARVSTGTNTADGELTTADIRLIRRLYADSHTSPFEMVTFIFRIVAPLFVTQQWLRHRTGSYNQHSGRYSVMEDKFYVPKIVRMQHSTNKQMSEGTVNDDLASYFYTYLADSVYQYDNYTYLCENGVARELARIGLPANIYTTFYYKTDLHNLLHFLKLRMAKDAQPEIQVYANAIAGIVEKVCPVTYGAFIEKLSCVTLNTKEIILIRKSEHYQEFLNCLDSSTRERMSS